MIKVCEGCGREYDARHSVQRYCCQGCVPADVKRANSRKGQAKRIQVLWLRRFAEDFRRMPRRMTRMDVMVFAKEWYWRGYRARAKAIERERRAKREHAA